MPFQSEKQRRYLHANHPEIAKRWEQEYAGGGIARKEFWTGGFPDFFQMTPENIATARSTPWSTALNQDLNPWSKDYRGFTTGYRGADKSGLGKYVSGGLKSLVGAYEPGSNIGGATNLMRKMALGTSKHLPKLLSKAALPFELLRSSPVNAEEAEMSIEDFENLNKSMGTNSEMASDNVSDPSVMQPHDFEFGDEWIEGSDKGGILDWITNKGTGLRQGLSLANENYLMPAVAGLMGIANRYNPLREGSQNYNKDLKGQVDMLNQMGMLGDQSSPYKITSGPLAGKNLVSAFGTNDYGRMLDKKLAWFEKRKADEKSYSQKLWDDAKKEKERIEKQKQQKSRQQSAIERSWGDPSRGDYGNPGGSSGAMTSANQGTYCFDPSTPIQMADGSTKEIKNIQLGDDTKGGEVTGVFQFKATDEIHDYKGVTVAGSHYVKEDGRFIMVQDSPLSIKIDPIPVVYSLDTTGRRIFINDIEFADYNGDGVAKNFLDNAGVDLPGFNKEVLRQVEQRLI